MRYELEYARSSRAQCHGHCKQKIGLGQLRLGSIDDKEENAVRILWRHFPNCVSNKLLSNVIEHVGSYKNIEGFDELKRDDQNEVRSVFQTYEEERMKSSKSLGRHEHELKRSSASLNNEDVNRKRSAKVDVKLEHRITEALLESDSDDLPDD